MCGSTTMRHCLLIVILAVAGLATTGCEQIEAKQKRHANTESKISQGPITDDKAPLLLDDEPFLLFDDRTDTAPSAGAGADNSRCFVCHINYMQEVLAVTHARANIGCKDCHGESDTHIADESWASGGTGTPPDIMYPRAKINPACMTCHPRDKINTEQHQVLFASPPYVWRASTAEGPRFAGTQERVCTDCHGKHRLTHRRCKWK